MTIGDRGAEPVDGVEVAKVEWYQGRAAANRLDRVVEFFETADRSRNGDDMRAFRPESARDRRPDTARRAGHQGNATGEPLPALDHAAHSDSDSRDS